jgi:protein MYSM1
MDLPEDGVSDVERMACSEFFAGHHAKTPERYMKIRNYIVQRWRQACPRYLTKTAVCMDSHRLP